MLFPVHQPNEHRPRGEDTTRRPQPEEIDPWNGTVRQTVGGTALGVAVRECSKPKLSRIRDASWDIPREEDMSELVTTAEASALVGC